MKENNVLTTPTQIIATDFNEKLEKQLNLVIKPKPKLLPKFIYKKLFW